ncbi:S41 family peptidase [Pseudalkalibacillus sp. Hm43]|uniref:S41 family peptidase n=1 Tax=Pseudalkalibacillus sp. Hm43 TaxID=3450742 RepID=UPI003F4296DB
MGFREIFKEIVSIMHEDYSGCEAKKGWDDPDYFFRELKLADQNGSLDNQTFYEIVTDYLSAFKDQHVKFKMMEGTSNLNYIGYRVEYYVNKLYVTHVDSEKRLSPGMKITQIDQQPLHTYDTNEQNWSSVLERAKCISIEDLQGNVLEMDIRFYENPKHDSKYTYMDIRSDVGLLSINDFMDKEQMVTLLKENHNKIIKKEKLIIDIRSNRGGMDAVYEPLLKYIFPPESIITYDSTYHLITKRNYDNRMDLFNGFLEQYGQDDVILSFIDNMKKYKEQGFVQFDLDTNEEVIDGLTAPETVMIITDRYCGSSGDQFALIASQSPKVRMIGRPTKGVLDYSNVAKESFPSKGFELWYPTSISDRVQQGKGIDNIGVQPDHHIPWTPEHLDEDVDLRHALDYNNRLQKA